MTTTTRMTAAMRKMELPWKTKKSSPIYSLNCNLKRQKRTKTTTTTTFSSRPRYEQGESTESTAEATETETSESDEIVATTTTPRTLERSNNENHSDSSSSSEEDDDDDDDSLDLGGVPTSIWPSQQQTTVFSTENNNNSAIAGVQISNLTREYFSPNHPTQNNDNNKKLAKKGRGLLFSDNNNINHYTDDDEESLDDDDGFPEEDQHEGAKVFLATQGSRYSGNKDDVYEIHNDHGYQTVKADYHLEGGGTSTDVNKLFREPGIAWNAVETNDSDDSDKVDELNFQPRYGDGNDNDGDDDDDADMWEDLNIETTNETGGTADDGAEGKKNDSLTNLRGSKTPEKDATCFGGVKLVSPRLFDGSDKRSSIKSEASKGSSLFSPLSSIVHSIDPELFEDKTSTSPVKQSDASVSSSVGSESALASVASCPVYRSPGSVLRSDQYTISGTSSSSSTTQDRRRRSTLSSAFKSSTKSNRVAYSLSSGKKGMSKSEKLYTKSFLPNKPLVRSSSASASLPRCLENDHTLFVLLVEK